MTERVKKQLELLKKREYRKLRGELPVTMATEEKGELSDMEYFTFYLETVLREETPRFYGDDIFGFYRSKSKLPNYKGPLAGGNVTVDYKTFLEVGLSGIREKIMQYAPSAKDDEAKEFYACGLRCLDAMEGIAIKYRDEAKKTGNEKLYDALCQVPFKGARDYYEALVGVKFLNYVLRIPAVHITFGRFDNYMRPYYRASLQKGVTEEEILELTELFFISLNFDSDLYSAVQLGDNGMSMLVGGYDKQGNETFDRLSEACLAASESLCLIDPKINIRVNKNTPLSLYERGTKLTKQGLGFPQYCNDDVVIEGLVALGYDLEDARDYSVAACWEFIPSGCGAETPNAATMNFPLMVDRALKTGLVYSETFEDFMERVKREIRLQGAGLRDTINNERVVKPKFCNVAISLFTSPCIERGRDLYNGGAKYENYGFHGAGISIAADALEAIERAVYIDKIVTKEQLICALNANFEGYEPLRQKLIAYPKMGNNEESVDKKAIELMDCYASDMNGKRCASGGIFRAGTGSAQAYIKAGKEVGATADGRKAFEPLPCSYAPSLTARLNGPLSAVQSFTKYDLKNIINGGPFTIEIHDTVFRNEEGEKKVAMLVKSFIDRGGHQMQINAINRDRLLDAQKNPENYPNLIVRVWGWSGYFTELDKAYQDQIIKRTEFSI